MGDIEQEREAPTFTTLPIDWHIPDNAQSRYANTATVAPQSPHTDSNVRFLADSSSTFQPPRQRQTVITNIDGPLPGGRQLVHPITVVIEFDDGEVILSEPEFHMHASAPTENEALNAFRRILSGYLDSLARREKTLGPQLRDQLNYLRSVIVSE